MPAPCFCYNVVKVVKVKMVKIDFGNAVILHYNKYMYIFIIMVDFDIPFSILTNDQMTK